MACCTWPPRPQRNAAPDSPTRMRYLQAGQCLARLGWLPVAAGDYWLERSAKRYGSSLEPRHRAKTSETRAKSQQGHGGRDGPAVLWQALQKGKAGKADAHMRGGQLR